MEEYVSYNSLPSFLSSSLISSLSSKYYLFIFLAHHPLKYISKTLTLASLGIPFMSTLHAFRHVLLFLPVFLSSFHAYLPKNSLFFLLSLCPLVRQGMAWKGKEWKGMAWKGKAWHGKESKGMEGHGKERHGIAWKGKEFHGKAMHGMAWKGKARQGKERK
jgi:hypothetical protein